GAFLHDVGKGLPGDHSVAGAPIAAAVAARMGYSPADAAVVEKLVRMHLLVPETATRRDLDDPLTIAWVAEAVGDVAVLDLLHALARADARATGPGAWSGWKERLVADLVGRVRTALDTGVLPAPPEPDPVYLVGPLPTVHLDGDVVVVAAPQRRGLLAAVVGCLAMHKVDVVTLDASTVNGKTLTVVRVQPRFGVPPDPAVLRADLRRAAGGDVSVTQRLGVSARPGDAGGAAPRVVWHRDAATEAALLELRAADSSGLLHRVTTALDEAGAVVRAARISTLGGDAVDVFYLSGGWPDEAERNRLTAAVLAAADPGPVRRGA
ncbi:MAG TPA: HD domain-containing protein, partial [Micromonosporaceae bacterium]|nr:HD domain-containing protein [Micromonosporaceae bacterium]